MITLEDYVITKKKSEGNNREISAFLRVSCKSVEISGRGNWPIFALIDVIALHFGTLFEVVNYNEHNLSSGNQDKASTYIEVSYLNSERQMVRRWGCGVDNDVSLL